MFRKTCLLSAALGFTTLASSQTTDYESGQGFSLGSLHNQHGWQVSQGQAEVVDSGAYHGTQSVALADGTPAIITKLVSATSFTGVVYWDFFAVPVAASPVDNSTLFEIGGGKIGVLLNSTNGVVRAYDGAGGGSWTTPTPQTILPLNGSNQTINWHRFTLRQDFDSAVWDLYVDGNLVAYNLGFRTANTGVPVDFTVKGVSSASSRIDDVYGDIQHPLFENQSNDGISDAWKTALGLNPATSYRSTRINGTLLLEYYRTGQNPADPTDGRSLVSSSPNDHKMITYAYDAAGRLASATYDSLSAQTLTFDNANNLLSVATVHQPIVAWRTIHGLSSDGSGTGSDAAVLASDDLNNVQKYALGLDPHTASDDPHPVVFVTNISGSSYLTAQYTRPDPAPSDITYAVQVSSDGVTWSNGVAEVSTTAASGIASVIVRDLTPISPPSYTRRIRLSITRTSIAQ